MSDRPRGDVRVVEWRWGADERRRPGLPWIGIFLVVFGALLLLDRFLPQFETAGSAFLLAVGLVLLGRWVLERGSGSLYAGALITAVALPNVLEGSGIVGGPGLGTLCLGLAFLFIALVRYLTKGGVGWQAWLGGMLSVIGLLSLAVPGLGPLVIPAVLVALGVLLVMGGSLPGRQRWMR
jgi:hypothetical protein